MSLFVCSIRAQPTFKGGEHLCLLNLWASFVFLCLPLAMQIEACALMLCVCSGYAQIIICSVSLAVFLLLSLFWQQANADNSYFTLADWSFGLTFPVEWWPLSFLHLCAVVFYSERYTIGAFSTAIVGSGFGQGIDWGLAALPRLGGACRIACYWDIFSGFEETIDRSAVELALI